jgi:DNA anti-recombination protein RmuC
LAQIASIVDNAASIHAIQTELTGKFNGVMMALDSRDRDFKTRYAKIYESLNSLEDQTSALINETFTNVSQSVRGVRTTIVSRLAQSIEAALGKGRSAAAEVEHNVVGAVEGHQQTSLIMALVYFGIFQGVLAISLYLIRAYVKNENLTL